MSGWPVTRPMAQNYDPTTGISIRGACMEGCGPPCVPRCVLDPDRCTDMIYGPPGLEMKFNQAHAEMMTTARSVTRNCTPRLLLRWVRRRCERPPGLRGCPVRVEQAFGGPELHP